MNDFYERFVRMCKIRGISPSAVCKKIGIGTPNVTYWKNGSVPRTKTLQKIAKALNVDINYFVSDIVGDIMEEEAFARVNGSLLNSLLDMIDFEIEFIDDKFMFVLNDRSKKTGYEVAEIELDVLQNNMLDFLKYQVWKLVKDKKAITKGGDRNAKT